VSSTVTWTIVPGVYASADVASGSNGTPVTGVPVAGTYIGGAITQGLSTISSGTVVTLTIQEVDQYGNPITTGTGTASVTFSPATRTPTPSTLTGGSTLNFTNGVASITYTPGSSLTPAAADTITITGGGNTDTITTNNF
jgi:hypothetical protein